MQKREPVHLREAEAAHFRKDKEIYGERFTNEEEEEEKSSFDLNGPSFVLDWPSERNGGKGFRQEPEKEEIRTDASIRLLIQCHWLSPSYLFLVCVCLCRPVVVAPFSLPSRYSQKITNSLLPSVLLFDSFSFLLFYRQTEK